MGAPTKEKIVCLMGPTASGKTQLAIELLQTFPFEIISVDSAMVYRGMDIGTAKPNATTLQIAPHRLIDIRDPNDTYSAAQFRLDALHEIEDILTHKKIPLLVGGTMLYFSALRKGLAELPGADTAVRAQLTLDRQQQGLAVLHERLQKIDPFAAERIHPHDSQRIQRALEVYAVSGKNLTTWQQTGTTTLSQYEIIYLAIAPTERAVLHERIEKRFLEMLAAGFLDEVKSLFDRGDLNLETPAIRSVGYRQAWEYFLKNYSYNEMVEKSIIATRQIAKRQLTWLRHWPDEIIWLDTVSPNLTAQAVSKLETRLAF
jgi:tRNA dimethylallyltransferase